MTKWKTKYKTGATKYTRKSYVEEYLENLVLGSAPCTVSWVGALAFDPTSLPSGSWDVTPTAKRKKQKEEEKTDRKREREPGTRARERNPHGQPGQARNWTPRPFHFSICVWRFLGRRPLLGSRVGARGSALDPPPFQSQTEHDLQTGGQRRASLEPQMVARQQRWSFERS